MPKFNWTDITREDVIKAIRKFIIENLEFPEPRSTFLVYENKRLPAKHIRGMAYAVHYGYEISKSDFGGGMETVRFFERLGFEVDYRGSSVANLREKMSESSADGTVSRENSVDSNRCKEVKVIKETKPITKKKESSEKISIPAKQVIEQKNALQLILNKMFDGDIVCEKTYPWLKTPEVIQDEYKELFFALSSYRGNTAFAKKNVTLRCDFVCEGQKLIIEYDERQHFSTARKVALESYRNIPVYFDRELWIKACDDIDAKDNAPQNRDEVRAYYDSTRDIECYKHGYRIVRIMHGQIDFEKPDAIEKLKKLIPQNIPERNQIEISDFAKILKVCMYLQTDELKDKKNWDKAMEKVKQSDVDLVVFPEYCFVPGIERLYEVDLCKEKDIDLVFDTCLEISEYLGRAVVVSSQDAFGSIYSVYSNAFASEEETVSKLYVKHTMTYSSALEFENYRSLVEENLFGAILYKGFKIGMTICYDCNHALFSRMYELCDGVDLIVNSTGGNVVYDKWFKYNKARAIENSCYNLVTMGGDGNQDNPHCYVYGFNSNGGLLKPLNLNGKSYITNDPGGLYVYEVNKNPGNADTDDSNIFETVNKKWQLEVPIGNIQTIIDKADIILDNMYRLKVAKMNVILCIVDGMDIMKAEKVLPLLYSPEIKKYGNRKYIIVNRHEHIDETFYREKLSTILKVRSMENFCAVILESDDINKCFQCGKNRTAQVVRATDGFFGIDLDRTTGPEAIWKNKQGMKAEWRDHFEWLINKAATM